MYLIFILFIGVVVNYFDAYYFPNYFFSHFRIDPQILTSVLGLVFLVVIFPKLKIKPTPVILLIIFIMFISFVGLVANSLTRIMRVITESQSLSQNQALKVYGEKMKFIGFVKKKIPENSILLIPPNTLPWRHTGDFYLMQAWLYPRKIISTKHSGFLSPKVYFSTDYVLISSESDGKTIHTWPDFKIPASKIIIYNWENQSSQEFNNIDYDPKHWSDKKPWGLIVPKKK